MLQDLIAAIKRFLRGSRHMNFPAILFLAGVVLPVGLVTSYLYAVAQDQYASRAAFSIRSEQGSGGIPQGFLGAIANVGGATGSAQDTDLLFDYIRSQAIVETIDKKLDLRGIFKQRGQDVIFSLPSDASIEELVEYWNNMVSVSSESQDGILRVEARAFLAEDAYKVVEEILSASSELINQLSNDARNDSLRLSSELVNEAREDLQDIRHRLTKFRQENKIITPEMEAETTGGVIASLQGKIAEALVERDSILNYSNESDPRVLNIENRLQSLRAQLENERSKLSDTNESSGLDVFAEYESLLLDQEMLNAAYGQALVNQASAHAELRRQARYVAVHVQPSLAETALYPQRLKIVFVTSVLLLLTWSIAMIFYKNTRDKF